MGWELHPDHYISTCTLMPTDGNKPPAMARDNFDQRYRLYLVISNLDTGLALG